MESVRRMRREKGLSQQELAELAGVGQDSISAIETGKHEPHPRTLRKLAKALDVEVADFFKEPAPLAKAPREAGPSLLDKALDAARQDEEKDAGVMAREFASEGVAAEVASGYAEDKIRAELRRLDFPDEHFESFIWPLVVKAAQAGRLEQENAQLTEMLERMGSRSP
jgi:transcriptional regulator with XRE-family HTH domain